ncbi:hypothetical protein V757_02195 [Pelistega indica]|uniref:Uncharacterized protein n=1 Tax=Pelistega indica TaxID=1414851 RepID=V8G9I3_9BURK|nr:hypothetical protein [Pelistega indica]ETD72771.1 hypothetical protein V757_02195 [Pelistega indica]
MGKESAPSFASNEQDIDDGEPVSITGFLTPPSEFGITHIRIYRRVTGHRSDTEAMGATPLMTDFYHVGTIEVGTATFIDKGLNIDTLGEALTTFDVLEPPAGLRGILAVPNTRILVGFDGNTLCFSMNNQPYNWPESRRYNLDDNIVAIRESGGMLYVMTDGHPYVVEIDAGDDIRTCQSILRLPTPMPMITCCSAKGALSTPMGVFYVSSKGLVRLAQGAITVVTMPWFASDDWRELKPETMRLGYAHGAIFIVSDTHAFVFFTDDATYGDSDAYRLTTIDLHPRDMVTGRNGELFMLLGNGIYQWDAGARFMPYRWKSAKIKSTRYGYFGAIRLWGSGSVDVSIFAEAQTVLSAIPLRPQTSYRLPRYGHHLHHQIELAGIHTVESVELANTRWDLSKV